MRTTTEHRRAHRAPMTLDEALRIEAQYDAGRLDPSLPGTADIVAEARRVRFLTELWGAGPQDQRRRQLRWLLWIAGGFIVFLILGLIACLGLTQ